MIAVIIDRPLGDRGIGFFGVEDLLISLIAIIIKNRMAVNLPCIGWASVENRASLGGFSKTNRSRNRRPRTVIQIQQNNFMPQRRQPQHGPAATILRIARMSAGNNDLQLARRFG